jgi:gliding motility-associated-like protein
MLDSLVNLSPNLYQVTVSDANGCKSISDYQIFNNSNDCLTIWTSFSPDGDGVNDVWNIGHIELYPENTVQIFNRWGALLFESKGYSQPWDGTWQNKELPAETYYYVINLGDGSDILTGTVTIIR